MSESTAITDPEIRHHRSHEYGRWRAASLIAVYVLMGLHIAHWRLTGRTLAPLELNEVMYTLELGIVTAGFLFMIAAVISTAIFGRFFCSWGCHILALEDLSAWLLGKVGIRPKPVRSRVLLLVPIGAMVYMFIWPQLAMLFQGQAPPALHLRADGEGWASFVTSDFWRNLPGPGVALLTFFVCGFLIIYMLGTRSFCKYACPYGAVFALADRISPGKIMARGDCSDCGICTARCTSNIRVHEELKVFGKVVSPSCLKDLDCVSSCPEGNIKFGFTRPSYFASLKRNAPRVRYDFSIGEDIIMVVIFIASLFIFRGLYGMVPFLLALAVGGISAYAVVIGWRLLRVQNVRLNNFQLKYKGTITGTGKIAVVILICMAVVFGHSAFIRYNDWQGNRLYDRVMAHIQNGGAPADAVMLENAIGHLKAVHSVGLFRPEYLDYRLATLTLLAGDDAEADLYLEVVRQRDRANAWELLGDCRAVRGELDDAQSAYESALSIDAKRHTARESLGSLLMQMGRFELAATHWAAIAEESPEVARYRYNYALVLAQIGRTEQAIAEYRTAEKLAPNDADIHNNLGLLLLNTGALDEAAQHLRQAIQLNPKLAHAHFNLGRVLVDQKRFAEAEPYLLEAARLDRSYAELLGVNIHHR